MDVKSLHRYDGKLSRQEVEAQYPISCCRRETVVDSAMRSRMLASPGLSSASISYSRGLCSTRTTSSCEFHHSSNVDTMKPSFVQLLSFFSSFLVPSLALNGNSQQQSLDAAPPPLSKSSESELIYLHRKLVEFESITGDELEVGRWLTSYLESHGLTVEKQRVSHLRYNLIAYPGDDIKTDILVSSHIDTVPPYWKYEYRKHDESDETSEQYSGVDVGNPRELKKRHSTTRSSKDTIWGRGSVDDKASVAAQTIAVLDMLSAARADNLSPPSISLLFVVGEEQGGDGMRYFSAHKPTNYTAIVFGEPTEGKLAAGHKGNLGFNLKVKGKAAHSGYPWLGVSANDVMVEALGKLRVLEDELPKSEKYGQTTLNIGKVDGGVAPNVVAETAEAAIMLRVAAGDPTKIKPMILDALQSTAKNAEDKGGSLEVQFYSTGYGPIDIDTDIKGFETITVNYGTDIPWLEGDHKRYLYGPGSILVAHSDHEHLTVGELEKAVDDYKKILGELLGRL